MNGARQLKTWPAADDADELITAITKLAAQSDAEQTTHVTQLTKAQIEFADLRSSSSATPGCYVPEEIESASSILKAVQWFADHYNPHQTIPPDRA